MKKEMLFITNVINIITIGALPGNVFLLKYSGKGANYLLTFTIQFAGSCSCYYLSLKQLLLEHR